MGPPARGRHLRAEKGNGSGCAFLSIFFSLFATVVNCHWYNCLLFARLAEEDIVDCRRCRRRRRTSAHFRNRSAATPSERKRKQRSKVPNAGEGSPSCRSRCCSLLIIDNKNIKKLKCINRIGPLCWRGRCWRASFCGRFPFWATKMAIMDGRNCKAIWSGHVWQLQSVVREKGMPGELFSMFSSRRELWSPILILILKDVHVCSKFFAQFEVNYVFRVPFVISDTRYSKGK